MLILLRLFHGTVHVVFLWEDGFIYAVIISCEGIFKYLIWRWSLRTKLPKKQYINTNRSKHILLKIPKESIHLT